MLKVLVGARPKEIPLNRQWSNHQGSQNIKDNRGLSKPKDLLDRDENGKQLPTLISVYTNRRLLLIFLKNLCSKLHVSHLKAI